MRGEFFYAPASIRMYNLIMKIILDTMGFENSIQEPIIAARKFVKDFSDVEIILVGDKNKIFPHLKDNHEFEIHHTTMEINQDDDVLNALRTKSNSSMAVAMDLVQSGIGDGVLSAGSTPCFVGMSYFKFGVIKNISKPALIPSFPSSNGKGFNMLDVGANIEVSSDDLVSFALMANTYVQKTKNIKAPTIGLLNIGTEETKGLDFIRQAHKILKLNKEINYVGFVESRDLLKGETDIVVSDGFTGNICLKAMEGSFKVLIGEFKKGYKKPTNWLGALFSIGVFRGIKKTFDYRNNAGAIFLGLNKVAVKTHGSADWKQFYSSLELTRKTINSGVIETLVKQFSHE